MKLTHVLLAAPLLASAILFAAPTVIRGPYLQLATPTSMVVRWRTDTTETSVVTYGTARNELKSNAKSAGTTADHVVQLSKLQPNTRYYYAVGPVPFAGTPARDDDDDAPAGARVNSFVTPPEAGTSKPTRVWVLGDPGTANNVQRAVRDHYYTFTGTRGTDLWLLLGDNAYPHGTDAEHQRAIFDIYPETLRSSPVWPAMGNHDAGSATSLTQSGVFFDVFTLPTMGQAGGMMSGTEAYYAFDYANIHFICLDSHDTDRSETGAMMQWLKADLAATKRDWIVAFFHHPTYTKGTHNSDSDTDSGGRMKDMRQNFLPVLEAGGVDLVLTGHSHVYERSFLIDGHYGKSETFNAAAHVKQKVDGRADGTGVYRKPRTRAPHLGEISVVTGSAGHASAKPVPLNHPVFFLSLNEAGSSVIDVDGLKLEFTFINDKGEKRDWFTIVKE